MHIHFSKILMLTFSILFSHLTASRLQRHDADLNHSEISPLSARDFDAIIASGEEIKVLNITRSEGDSLTGVYFVTLGSRGKAGTVVLKEFSPSDFDVFNLVASAYPSVGPWVRHLKARSMHMLKKGLQQMPNSKAAKRLAAWNETCVMESLLAKSWGKKVEKGHPGNGIIERGWKWIMTSTVGVSDLAQKMGRLSAINFLIGESDPGVPYPGAPMNNFGNMMIAGDNLKLIDLGMTSNVPPAAAKLRTEAGNDVPSFLARIGLQAADTEDFWTGFKEVIGNATFRSEICKRYLLTKPEYATSPKLKIQLRRAYCGDVPKALDITDTIEEQRTCCRP